LVQHAGATAHYSIFYGTGRDAYDIRGRTAHECVFNVNDGVYRCPNSQQGYSPFSTWTRGLAWAMCGFSEQLEFFGTLADTEFPDSEGKNVIVTTMRAAAEATCDFYLANTPTNGLPYWDTGAPGLAKLGDWAARAADPFNDHEPVDSSAALIAAQGLLRLGKYLGNERYRQAGLTIANAVFDEPYLSSDPNHQGLILHAVYHRPNDWDSIPAGRKIPAGESCMWGDYHALELGVYLLREIENKPYLTFWSDSK
jgi:unsaturated chondroitin disaccharide hydrolase